MCEFSMRKNSSLLVVMDEMDVLEDLVLQAYLVLQALHHNLQGPVVPILSKTERERDKGDPVTLYTCT